MFGNFFFIVGSILFFDEFKSLQILLSDYPSWDLREFW